MKSKKPPRKELEKLIEKNFGNLTSVAIECGVSRTTITNWIKKDNSGKLELSTLVGREMFIDLAERKALELISSGNSTVILAILRTLGKDRGYVEQKRFDPNIVGELDLTQSKSGRIDVKVKHVLINSREDLDRVYQGDVKQIENKPIDSTLDAVDAEFFEED